MFTFRWTCALTCSCSLLGADFLLEPYFEVDFLVSRKLLLWQCMSSWCRSFHLSQSWESFPSCSTPIYMVSTVLQDLHGHELYFEIRSILWFGRFSLVGRMPMYTPFEKYALAVLPRAPNLVDWLPGPMDAHRAFHTGFSYFYDFMIRQQRNQTFIWSVSVIEFPEFTNFWIMGVLERSRCVCCADNIK